MNLNLTVTDDLGDEILCLRIEDAMTYLEEDIRKLKSRKRPNAWVKMQLKEYIKDLAALKTTHDYFGGNIKNEAQFKRTD